MIRRASLPLLEEEEERVLDLLATGFGVEDIALAMGLPLSAVRAFVFGMSPEVRREIYRQDG